ncbi:MAG: hypothetical protein COZ06_07010 [Armatimonadetes bacterium CG_4_10_14_3_um_filter_66_18]|nr:thiamine pyrophosphate-dependent dehydrogenase E1 component subunit alpha [Armatimonadota bacterium]NCQ31765.1 thiamine pyrophosphate-dependent dehydrogenase E1 component subunit alpha [Armatimonadota bacterium]PIX38291.1 MAG: hypothetical protein COZ57_30880 [Armatimonadetes bacterium CG_4_8_14_3_um_filter_66_20]PIY50897.1 MAG: hypothetical protein COZ06_07010 [Armatimonadetes bacterium CG_4_10_14_3_um_filter_66_18]PIZ47133.1 MAG: hypothetical protein COY42_09285 [Armatimonadetes bacterium 
MSLTTQQLVDCYRSMLLIREFEDRVDALFSQGVIRGTSHLYAGQEAIAVGTCAALRPADLISSTHRGHGHFLAKGGDPKLIMAELFGKVTGYAGGRGGSQHVACFELGFLGSNGITGGLIPVATGAALAIKQQGRSEVVGCFFGEGASNQGTFHEAINMGAIWKLPVIYLCENNLYAMFTPAEQTIPVASVADRAAAYGIPGVVVDGNDLFAVYDAVGTAAVRARAGEGPTLIEAKTYRFYGHSKSDKREYRTTDEEAHWHARDPIPRLAEHLLTHGVSQPQLDQLREEMKRLIDESVDFADQSPEPEGATAAAGLFA